jgi:hypothetical protein
MNKRDVLRLKPGQRLVYGDSMWTSEMRGKSRQGEVLHVTPRGGIRVLNQFGFEEWVPYHFAIYADDNVWWKHSG